MTFRPYLEMSNYYRNWKSLLLSLLTCVTWVQFRQNLTGHQHSWLPKRAAASRFVRQSRIEFEFGEVWPRMGGLSGIETKKLDKRDLKESRVFLARISFGTQFHSLGPRTRNELSRSDWWAVAHPLNNGGMMACVPWQSFTVNWILDRYEFSTCE